MSLYRVLLLVHIVMAIVWVGGAAVTQIYALRAGRAEDPQRRIALSEDIEWMGLRVFMPASLILVIVGAWMVVISEAWSFSQTWIWASLSMYAASFLAGAFYLGPQSGKLGQMVVERGPFDAEVKRLTGRLYLVSRFELAALFTVVALMVLKPGV